MSPATRSAVHGAAPRFSVVLPAYNEVEWLPQSLPAAQAAIAAATAAGYGLGELIVCDNNSTDGTGALAASLGAQVVFEPINQISRARNAGASQARGEFLVFVDSDTLLPPALLVEALRRLASGEVVGGGAGVAFDHPVAPATQRLLATWNRFAQRTHTAAGSFIYVRREAFEAVGGFSRDVYAAEEILFTRAIKRWAKPRRLRFEVIPEPPVVTSDRKARWYTPAQLWGFGFLVLFFPLAIRYRRLCGIWYTRPKTAT